MARSSWGIFLRGVAGALAGYAIAILLASISTGRPSEVARSVLWVYTDASPITTAILFSGPIAASALGLAIAYRARFITVGSEGQVILGSASALWLSLYSGLALDPLPTIALSMVLASLFGALYSLIVAVLRIYLGVNETLSSLMLNFVAMYSVNYMISTAWRVGPFTITRSLPPEYRLSYVAVASVLLILAIATWMLLARTRFGLAVEVYGRAPRAAETYGYSGMAITVWAALASGSLSGLGGALAFLGFQHSLTPMSAPPGYGYMGVLVAWLSANSPLAILPASVFFSSIVVLGRSLQAVGVPLSYVLAIQAMVVLLVLISATSPRLRLGWPRWWR